MTTSFSVRNDVHSPFCVFSACVHMGLNKVTTVSLFQNPKRVDSNLRVSRIINCATSGKKTSS